MSVFFFSSEEEASKFNALPVVMRGGDSTATKRSYSMISVPSSDHSHHSKRSKSSLAAIRGCNSATATKRRCSEVSEPSSHHQSKRSKRPSSAARSLSSKLIDINIDDLPNDVLVEIFCRLPSVSFVSQCKCVSKSWCTLMSDPYFIGRFLWRRSDTQTPIIPSLIDSYGDELLTTNVFKRFKSFLSWNKNSRVLATCNDLVLCCANLNDHHDFFICNPRTMQLVTLPPTPRCHISQPLGFICEPYYRKDDTQRKELNLIDVNAEYRCKVVRILPPDNVADEHKICFKFNIQVFSSETGEWRELVVPCPHGFSYCGIMSFASLGNNGFLYWKIGGGLIGLGPFTSNNSSSANGNDTADHYQFHVIEFDETVKNLFYGLHFLGVYQGCLRMCDHYDDSDDPELFIWELKEEELNEMAVDGTGKLGLKHMEGYALDREMIPEGSDLVQFIACDSNDLDIVYLQAEGDIIKCNICTGIWSKMAVKPPFGRVFQLMLPWWPTPVPRLRRHAHGHA